MNPELHARALQDRVAPETEGVFDAPFWRSLDVVVNALDNVKARRRAPQSRAPQSGAARARAREWRRPAPPTRAVRPPPARAPRHRIGSLPEASCNRPAGASLRRRPLRPLHKAAARVGHARRKVQHAGRAAAPHGKLRRLARPAREAGASRHRRPPHHTPRRRHRPSASLATSLAPATIAATQPTSAGSAARTAAALSSPHAAPAFVAASQAPQCAVHNFPHNIDQCLALDAENRSLYPD